MIRRYLRKIKFRANIIYTESYKLYGQLVQVKRQNEYSGSTFFESHASVAGTEQKETSSVKGSYAIWPDDQAIHQILTSHFRPAIYRLRNAIESCKYRSQRQQIRY